MCLSRNIFSVLVAACMSTGVVACKEANPDLSLTEESNFSTDVDALNSSLNLRLNEFEKVINSGQIATVLDFIPQKILNKILSDANVTRSQLNEQMDAMWEQTLQTVEVSGFELDKNANAIIFLSNGRPYKILPTSTKMTIKANGSAIVSKSETLALIERGEWYIVRLDDPAQVKLFRDAYPDFDDVQVMEPLMTMDGEVVKL